MTITGKHIAPVIKNNGFQKDFSSDLKRFLRTTVKIAEIAIITHKIKSPKIINTSFFCDYDIFFTKFQKIKPWRGFVTIPKIQLACQFPDRSVDFFIKYAKIDL